MEILICQSCGTVLRSKAKNCAGCGLIVSTHSPTTAPTLTNTNQALSVAVRPDPIVLERVLAKRAAGIEIYSKDYALGGAYLGANSSFGNNDNGSNGQFLGNGNSSAYEKTSAGANLVANPSSFLEPAPTQGVPGNDGFNQETNSFLSSNFQPANSAPVSAPENSGAPASGAFNFEPGKNGLGNQAKHSQEINQTEEESAVPQSAQIVSSNFIAAPASAFMSNQTFAEAKLDKGTTNSARPDFFASNPTNREQSPTTSQSNLPASEIQQRQSGSQNVLTNNRAQQSLSGAQPPPMTSGSQRALNTQSPMPPESIPPQEQPAPATRPETATAKTTADKVHDDDLIEQPKSASQLDFFASSKFPAVPSAAPSNKEENSLSRSPKSSNRDEGLDFAEPDTRKFTRSKNKVKSERLVAAPSESKDDVDDNNDFAKSKKAGFDFDAPQKSKNTLEESRKRNDGEDADFKTDLKKSSKSKKAAKEAQDDDDDDDDDFAPPRRSFSGNAPTVRGKTATKRSHKLVDEEDDDDDEHENDDDDDDDDDDERNGRRGKSGSRSEDSDLEEDDETSPPYIRFLKKPVRFLGLSMPRHMQLVVIGVFLVIVPMLIGFTGAVLSWSGEQMKALAPQEKMPLLTGDWHMQIMNNGKALQSDIELLQNGDNIYAVGSDIRSFYIIGRLSKPDHIQFNKLYRLPDGSFDKPIEYFGDFDLTQGRPYARGFWKVEKRQGAFYKAHTVTYTGQWQMKQTRVRSHVNVPVPDGTPNSQSNAGANINSVSGPKKPFWQTCFEVAGFLLVGSIVLVVIVWKSFGTNGTLSIMGKRQYIPSQYRGDHNKILAVLGKPPRPGSMPLGRRNEWKPFFPWEKKDLALPPEIRRKDPHMLLLGAGDKGKSRMIANLISADIEANDRAVVLIDSDGALVDLITRWISHHPRGRQFAKRVIVLDPTYKHGSQAYNPLEMPPDGDLQAAASSLVYGFKAIYTEAPGSQSQWNQQTANILRNAALLLMANGKTLTDLPTLLQDNDFRDILLENIERKKKEKTEYITLLDTWGQYKKLARTDQWINWVEPILNRVGPMLSDPRIRPILTQSDGQIKLTKVIQEKQILLVKIKKGHLDQNANLLGSLIVTGLKQAAMSLSGQQKQKPVALYLDQFDNFIEKETFESITSETDKFQIGLIGALRTLQHLPEDFRNNLIINVGTLACFALSKKDGDLLGPQMFRVDGRKIKHQTMSNFFNPVNTSPQFELISDEEKLNIDRVVGQDARKFYCYRVGSQAGVFHMRTHDFNDIPDRDVNHKLIEKMYGVSKKAADNDD